MQAYYWKLFQQEEEIRAEYRLKTACRDVKERCPQSTQNSFIVSLKST